MILHRAKESMLKLQNYIDENKVDIHFNDILKKAPESSYILADNDRGADDTTEFIISEFENSINNIKCFGNKYIPHEFITNLIIELEYVLNTRILLAKKSHTIQMFIYLMKILRI